MQMISCIPIKVTMADSVSPWSCDRMGVKQNLCKRKKCQDKHCVSHSLTDDHIFINTQNANRDSSFDNMCLGINSFSESSETGLIYLNPQTPNWSLVEKYAGLSSGEETELDDKVPSSPESSIEYAEDNTLYESEEQSNGNACTEYLKSRNVQRGKSARERASKVKEPTAAESSPDEDINKSVETTTTHPPDKDVLLQHASDDGKDPRFFTAMKKRSEGVDTTHRPYKCTHCHWAFKKYCNLQSHLQTHTGLKPHICDICGKAYSHQGTLQQHKRLHTGERPYHCPFCAKTYIWSSDYRKHIRTHTGEKPYICDTCGKDFIRSSDLRKHERNMHTNDKPFPCTHCDKTFNRPLSLKRHERKHLGERPFSCPDCGKTFALASRMAEHQKIHKGVRPYVCSVCSKCFTKSSNLSEHEAIHSGERPHKCAECGVAFAMASRLVRHQFVHSKEKPLNCTGCSKNFSHSDTLKHHQEQTCAGRIFVCVECDKSFQCAAKLAQHMLSHKDETT
ncbi:uncharacterized protein znf648 [Genypterus blacodes]|uniref:uncharacterized protein znf648 n=1 Tax=Genypterus blacodes TaxID=154954 RepID=UPI003F775816